MDILQNSIKCTFDTYTGPRMLLEQLKYDNQMEHVANQLMEIIPHVGIHSTRLKEIFTLTVVLNTAKPTSDLG
jgi:hypothetical protein